MGVGTWSYLTLIILSIIILGVSYLKYSNRLLLVHYFAVSGYILFFDYIIYAWGKAYKYYPNIIEGKYDTHLGALANAQIIPSFAILYIAFQLKWYWSILFACFFTAIELLFRHLDIFTVNWWQVWFTFVLLVPFFSFTKAWWSRLKQKTNKWLIFISYLSVFYVIFTQLNVFLYGVLKIRSFHVEWIERLNRESTTINTPTGILFGTVVTLLIMKKARNYWYFLLMIGYLMFDLYLKYVGIVRTDKIIIESILSFITFLLPMLFLKNIGNKEKYIVT